MARKTFKSQLYELGFHTYEDYLKSNHWESFKKRYYERFSKYCYCCRADRLIHLHHITYKNLGKERFEDVVPLCSRCHSSTHDLVKRGFHLYWAHKHYKAALHGWVFKKGRYIKPKPTEKLREEIVDLMCL